MDKFEYIMILVSLVLGLGITQIMTGLSRIINRWRSVRMFFPHVACMVVVFGLHVQEWWVNYDLSMTGMEWTFSHFMILIQYPLVLFIMSRLLFPVKWDKGKVDFKEFYLSNHRKLFLAAMVMAALAIPQNIILLSMPWTTQWTQALLLLILSFPVFANTRNVKFHVVLTSLMLGAGIFYVTVINPIL